MRAGLAANLLVFLIVLAIFIGGLSSGNVTTALLGLYGVLMSALCAYILLKQVKNPDRLRIDESGFEYKFLNITFRVGWGDVEAMRLKDSAIIQVRLHDPTRVAFASEVGRLGLRGRTRLNPYTRASLKDLLMLRGVGPKDSAALARLLEETGKHSEFHIQIPVFQSPEVARDLFAEMQRRRARWQPRPAALTDDPPALGSEQPPGQGRPTPGVERERQ